jgi:hypothetical protein
MSLGLDKTQTLCSDCGTVINDIQREEKQACRCKEITTYAGIVYETRNLPPHLAAPEQPALFAVESEYPG